MLNIFQATSLPEAEQFFYNNGLAIWHGSDIRHIKVIIADSWP